ncbi:MULTISPECIES: N-acetyltransferase [Paenibacillus]|jgi:amino-acid N-acetyltransferase|uniref:N-acetyltransferase n=1 Tax=Paenibacillus taichungensis TaxID=484184 RepID=A0A329QPH6_9BACL|nr:MULTISPECIES: N-acetyltransferase [Paenibacillus]OME84605.1 GNAT family N-acetyltransferase [Paenibacillus pabuli]MDR9747229.1 N-acetyltransferase [Paenibacillus taichungensis]MEC0108425.1 N-acetyltransferase [Paenibacillus taichungensis]MEC0195923.1 N-acetyltransferase [Paenibacillus taichungensis]NEU65241.1 N-acetyltransferase [Paenibacillus sp. ALJ109b]
MSAICRKAVPEDVEPLFEMIKGYAERGIMLPRSREVLQRQLEHFVVAEVNGQVVGCGSLCRLGNDLVEVRSLGISEGHKGMGIGSLLLDRLVEEAEKQQIPKVMALTYEVSFFLKNGFAVVNKEIFPEKVWTDCVHCSKQDCCDEIAVLKELNISA